MSVDFTSLSREEFARRVRAIGRESCGLDEFCDMFCREFRGYPSDHDHEFDEDGHFVWGIFYDPEWDPDDPDNVGPFVEIWA